MKDGGRESTCMIRSWQFHGKKNTSGGEISALWARSNPVSSPKTPAGRPDPEKHFSKISPGEFSKTGAMQGGGVIFETPLYIFRSDQATSVAFGSVFF